MAELKIKFKYFSNTCRQASTQVGGDFFSEKFSASYKTNINNKHLCFREHYFMKTQKGASPQNGESVRFFVRITQIYCKIERPSLETASTQRDLNHHQKIIIIMI